MSKNLGQLPLNLGQAKLQKSFHTLVHHYNLSPIKDEIINLSLHSQAISKLIREKYRRSYEILNYENLERNLYKLIIEKLNNIIPKKEKRGIINGLGTVVKFITGNMDANDASRIDKIFNHMKTEQNNIKSQINNQYSVNNELIKQFNSIVKHIQKNDVLFRDKIINIIEKSNNITNEINIIHIKDILNQLILTYYSILNLLNDIENSLTFCSLGAMHPSIINTKDLFHELSQLVPFYKDELPLPVNTDNIIRYQSLMNVHCKQDKDTLIYFLTFPIEYQIIFDLYYMQPVPVEIEGEYFTIIPNSQYLLKSQEIIKPLSDSCSSDGIYHCPSKLIMNQAMTCEENFINRHTTEGCLFTKLTAETDFLQPLQYTDKYLGWITKNSSIYIKCKNEDKVINPRGVFTLYVSDDCRINFNGEELPSLEPTETIPTVMDFTVPKFKQLIQQTNYSLQIKSLAITKISPLQINSNGLNNQGLSGKEQFFSPSVWTIILYGLALATLLFLVFKRYIQPMISNVKTAVPTTAPPEELKTLRPPVEASF